MFPSQASPKCKFLFFFSLFAEAPSYVSKRAFIIPKASSSNYATSAIMNPNPAAASKHASICFKTQYESSRISY